MDPEEQKLIGAIVAADKAGDTKSAQIFADLLNKRRASKAPAAPNPNAPNPITTAMQESTRNVNQRFANRKNEFQYIPTGMGIAPPSNLMRTPGGMYVENPEFEKPQDTLEGFARTASYGMAPYLTAAAAGAPFGGPGGSLAGMGALALSDLGVGLYNLAGTPFGAPRVDTPSQMIRNAMTSVAPDFIAPPQTPGQRVLFSGIDVAGGTLGGTALAKQAANALTRPNTLSRGVLETMGGGSTGVNVASGMGAGVGGQLAREANAPAPVQLLAELAGAGSLGGAAAGVNAMRRGGVPNMRPDQVQLTQQARTQRNQLYSDMESTGVRYDKADVRRLLKDFETRANTGLIPGLASAPPELKAALTQIRALLKTGTANLSGPRQLLELIDTFENSATSGRMPVLAGEFRRMLDDFMADPTKSTNVKAARTPAEIAQAQQDVAAQNALRTQATEASQRVYRAEQFDPVLDKIAADIANGVDPSRAIQNNLRTLAKNAEFARFATPEQRAAVLAAIQGDIPQNILRTIGSFSPGSAGLRGKLGQIFTFGGMGAGLTAPFFPPAILGPVVGGVVGGGTSAARQAANVSSETSLNRLGEFLKTGAMPPKPPTSRTGLATLAGTGVSAAREDETETKRLERERAKPKEKQVILETPKDVKEVQRMARVARDILADPQYAKKYKLSEISQLYNTLFSAGQEGYSDVLDLADEIANFHEARYAAEQGSKK